MSKNLIEKPSLKRFLVRFTNAIAIILIWRSIWNFTDMYVLPDRPIVSNLLTLIAGILILYIPDRSIKELVD
ncbi:hypothetical protein GF340_05815 [Candidatus Peregrinibacteria bacterium]|nr:hypothetical protein [Candidatus Peregrinibacteria bacterium]